VGEHQWGARFRGKGGVRGVDTVCGGSWGLDGCARRAAAVEAKRRLTATKRTEHGKRRLVDLVCHRTATTCVYDGILPSGTEGASGRRGGVLRSMTEYTAGAELS
jgi:hypothetical protein